MQTETPAPEIQLPIADLIKNILLQAGIEESNLAHADCQSPCGEQPACYPGEHGGIEHAWLSRWAFLNEQDLQIAIQLKKAGLPINPEIIELMKQTPLQLGQSIDSLIQQLSRMFNTSQSQTLNSSIQDVIRMLQNLKLNLSGSKEEIARQLQQIVRTLGQPVEHLLGDQIEGRSLNTETNLLSLAQLQSQLEAFTGPRGLSNEIQQVMDSIRQMQFQNSEPVRTPDGGQWLTMRIPIAVEPRAERRQQHQSPTGNIRISYRKKGDGREINEGYTRMVIEVDVNEDEVIAVDLTVAEKMIGAMITASNEELQNVAEEEMPAFEEGLADLGYDIAALRTSVGKHSLDNTPPTPRMAKSYNPNAKDLDMEI